ncbi:polymeric immunoglobulin receptor-like [Sebastes fasciatus]|uniref:polymeric immunoglobulin receptor-like n=1 Tax=Sebastes fasciatus TaxID=394691 RepID=UPI003D9EED62
MNRSNMKVIGRNNTVSKHICQNAVFVLVAGIHSITTVSKMSVKAGDSVTIPCLYDSKYTNHVKYLWKGSTWSSCSYAVKTNQQNSEKFSISDDKKQRIFTVTIKDLTDEDTDYWCAVEIDGGLDVVEYFHLSVNRGTPGLYVDHQEITGFKGDSITINCHGNSGEIAWCRLGSSCVTMSSGPIDGTRVTTNASVPNVFTVTMSGLRTESSGWYWCAKGDLQMPVHVTVNEQPTTSKYYK